jgi:hypothetical protein
MALDEHAIVAFANIANAMPLADIITAANDPSNLGKVAQVVEDIIGAAPLPPFTGEAIDLGIAGFVALVYASGGGTIEPASDPIHDAQTTPTPHSGRNA